MSSDPTDPAARPSEGADGRAEDTGSGSGTGTGSASGSGSKSESASGSGPGSGSGSGSTPKGRTRDVVVPLEVYKRVTVFSTLFAIVAVVGGFVALDRATDRATADLSEIDPLLALFGVGLMIAGSAAYAFSTRFRAEGMGNGNPKDESDEPSNDG